ncbi:beta-galactosidase, partial [Trifolium pratense]
GNKKHNIDGCFKVHGYPEWWNDMKAKKQKEAAGGSGRVALASAEPRLSLISQVEYDSKPTSAQHELGNNSHALFTSSHDRYSGWIVDSGATDHMTFCKKDLTTKDTPRRTSIINANGVTYPVIGAGTVSLSPSISLPNTLLVPSLSNKLISVGQATEDLNLYKTTREF